MPSKPGYATPGSAMLDATAVILDTLTVQQRTTQHLVNLARLSKRQEQRLQSALEHQRTANMLLHSIPTCPHCHEPLPDGSRVCPHCDECQQPNAA